MAHREPLPAGASIPRPPANPVVPVSLTCGRCAALRRERDTLVEVLALHDRDHAAEEFRRAQDAAITVDVQQYAVAFERALLERFKTFRPNIQVIVRGGRKSRPVRRRKAKKGR